MLSLVERFINPVSNEQKNIQLLERIYMNKNALLWLPRLFQIVKVFFSKTNIPRNNWLEYFSRTTSMTIFFHPLPLSIFLNPDVTMQNNIERDEREGEKGGRGAVAVREGGSLII